MRCQMPCMAWRSSWYFSRSRRGRGAGAANAREATNDDATRRAAKRRIGGLLRLVARQDRTAPCCARQARREGGVGGRRGEFVESSRSTTPHASVRPGRRRPPMLARLYLIAGSLLLGGYALSCWQGWEFGAAEQMASAPAPGTALQ